MLMDLPWTEKYRPHKLIDVIGQESIINRLIEFVKNENFPNMIFAGSAGIGKTTCAIAMANDLYKEEKSSAFKELNASVTPNTPILIKKSNKINKTTIGAISDLYFNGNNTDKYAYPKDLEILSINKKTLKIEFLPIKNISRHKVSRIRKISMESSTITTTLNHSIIIIDSNGKFKSIKAEKLDINDSLISFKTLNEFNNNILSNIEIDDNNNSNSNNKIILKTNNRQEIKNTLSFKQSSKNITEKIYKENILLNNSKNFSSNSENLIELYSNNNFIYKPISSTLVISPNNILKVNEKLESSQISNNLITAKPFVEFLKTINIKFNWEYELNHSLYYKKNNCIEKQTILHILDQINNKKLLKKQEEKLNYLKLLAMSDIYSLIIKNIIDKDYKGYVYDVSVPNSEMFWGGETPILLHNSDTRGIDIIRGEVKEFAKTIALSKVPIKIIFLDEADSLTSDAQHALRRTMEKFSAETRFILSANYASKIIEPIQSRCIVFRFKLLNEKDIKKYIERVAKAENLEINENAIQALIYISEGDLRKLTNIMQTASLKDNKITERAIYEISARAKPKEIQSMIRYAVSKDFEGAKKELDRLILNYGMSGEDILVQCYKEIQNMDLDEHMKLIIISNIGETNFRIIEGANERIQLEAMIANIAIMKNK